MNKNIRKITIGVLVVVLIGGLGYWYYKSKQKTPTTTSNYIALKASRMKLSVNVQGTGTVVGDLRSISPNSNGQLQNFSLKVGDAVKAGAAIGSINSDQLQNSVTKAQNNVSKQKIQLSNLNNSLKNAQAQLASAQNDLNTAQSQLATASPADAKALNDKITNLQNQISTQNNNILNYQNQIATQNLTINDAQNDLNTATSQLSQATLTSPIDGVVTAVNNSNGDSVQQGKAVITIINPSSFNVKVSVDELDISKIQKGEKVEITFGALKDKKFTGKVNEIGLVGTTTNNVTTYDVTIILDSIEGIELGMTASVNIEVASKDNALVIPVEALIEKSGKKYVMEPTDSGQTSGLKGTSQASDTNKPENKGGETGGTSPQGKGSQTGGGNTQGRGGQIGGGNAQYNAQRAGGQTYSGGKLVEIQTGLQNENYIEVINGIEEGQKVLVALPKTSSSPTQKQGQSGFGGGGFGGGGGLGGGNMGSGQRQGGSTGGK